MYTTVGLSSKEKPTGDEMRVFKKWGKVSLELAQVRSGKDGIGFQVRVADDVSYLWLQFSAFNHNVYLVFWRNRVAG